MYYVQYHGSEPDRIEGDEEFIFTQDDCWDEFEFAALPEAEAKYAEEITNPHIEYITLEGHGQHQIRVNPHFCEEI